MNKRAMILDNIFPMIFIIIVLIMIILPISFKLSAGSAQQKVSELVAQHEAQVLLSQYLEETIEYDGKQMKVIEFIKNAQDNDPAEKVQLFKSHAANFFEKLRLQCWSIILKDEGEIGAVGAGIIRSLQGKVYIANGKTECTDMLNAFVYSLTIQTRDRTINVYVTGLGGSS